VSIPWNCSLKWAPNIFNDEALVEGQQVWQQQNTQRKHSVVQLSSQKIPHKLLQKWLQGSVMRSRTLSTRRKPQKRYPFIHITVQNLLHCCCSNLSRTVFPSIPSEFHYKVKHSTSTLLVLILVTTTALQKKNIGRMCRRIGCCKAYFRLSGRK